MTRVTNFGQSPDTVLVTEMNNIQDDYEKLFSEYKVFHYGCLTDAGLKPGSNFYMLAPNDNHSAVARVSFAQQATTTGVYISPQCFFYWDPEDYADLLIGVSERRALKLRMRSVVICNGPTAPGQSFTFGIRNIQSFGGGSSVGGRGYTMPFNNIAGFATTHTTPAANSITVQTVELADATTLAPDIYALFWTNAAAPAGSCDLHVDLAVKIDPTTAP